MFSVLSDLEVLTERQPNLKIVGHRAGDLLGSVVHVVVRRYWKFNGYCTLDLIVRIYREANPNT